ncbi:glycosyltransferase family 39 protein [Candidatus Woesearchaeota archaeon]|nr:glycosyltransferase family 39 protein [Candidatus Woesearchaeota archaeon]
MRKLLHDGRFLLVLVFLLFALFRFFQESPYTLIVGDIARYLSLTKSFPYHTLYNHLVYTGHPPFFPYVVRLFSTVFALDIASKIVSFVSSLLFFLAVARLFSLFSKGKYWIATSLLLLVLNFYHIFMSTIGMKESFIIALFYGGMYYYLRGLQHHPKYFIHASLIGAALMLTTELAVFLIPALLLALLIYKKGKLLPALAPILVMLLAFAAWSAVKYALYLQHPYYPDILGIAASTENLNIMGVLNPAYFSATTEIATLGVITSPAVFAQHAFYIMRSLINLAYPFNLIGPDNVILLHKWPLLLVIYLPLLICMLAGAYSAVRDTLKKRAFRDNHGLFMLGLAIILLPPIVDAGLTPRHQLQLIIPLAYFAAAGLWVILRKLRLLAQYTALFPYMLIAFAVIMAPLWIFTHPYPITAAQPLIQGKDAALFLSSLPGDGILDWGEMSTMTYLTDKRIITLPPNPDDLDFQIQYYNISYLSFLKKPYYASPTIPYIQSHPEKYRRIAAIPIRYPGDVLVIGEQTNQYLIYQAKG